MFAVDYSSNYEIEISQYLDNVWKNSFSEDHTLQSLEEINLKLQTLAYPFLAKYPLITTLDKLSKDIYNLIKEDRTNLEDYGIQIGWIRERMDFSNFLKIHDLPYQTLLGYGRKKGKFSIEENVLLKDAFNILEKSKQLFEQLGKITTVLPSYAKSDKIKFETTKSNIPYLEFDMACYSRLTILSFFAFFESFVNSIGYNFLMENRINLNDGDKNILKGLSRNGKNYINLKSRVEKFQLIMRDDNKVVLNLTDANQIQNPFSSIFSYYKELRDSSMHNSPLKENIHLSAQAWNVRAIEFSKLTMNAAQIIWKSLVTSNKLPEYLLELDYNNWIEETENRHNNLKIINTIIDGEPDANTR